MSQQLPPSQMPAFPTIAGAWAVEVVTGGGLMGLTKRTVIDSGGAVACPASCVAPARRQIEAMAAAVKSAERLEWTLSRSGICRDCMVYRVSIWVRNEDGSIRSRSASWDSVTTLNLGAPSIPGRFRNALVEGTTSAMEAVLALTLFLVRLAPSAILLALVLAWPAVTIFRRVRESQ